MLEVEVKIKIDPLSIIGKLEELGFRKTTTVYEYDIYFNGQSMDLKAQDKALRIREHRDMDSGKTKFVLNFKGPKLDQTTMTREETQFEVPSLEMAEKVINGLGFFAAGRVEKTRKHYIQGVITCCIDHVTNLGDFLEIEIMSEETDYSAAKNEIENLLHSLDLSMSDTIRESYLSLLS